MEKYVRDKIKELKSYQVNKVPYTIKLDANEGIDWNEGLNRYPDDSAEELIGKLGKWLNKPTEQLVIGNGSSELIELTLKTFLDPDECVVSLDPTFSMYQVFTTIYNGRYAGFKLNDDFEFDTDEFIKFIEEEKPKIVLLSNPNNPTGKSIPYSEIIKIVKTSDAIVVLDEAYIEFGGESLIDVIDQYDNLIILRTFSKAFGLAGIRLGYMVSNESVIGYIKRVKSPYNVNQVTQANGIKALDNMPQIKRNIALIKEERSWLYQELLKLDILPVDSTANFILFKYEKPVAKYLLDEGIQIRKFSGKLDNYYRITVGTKEENQVVIQKLKECIK